MAGLNHLKLFVRDLDRSTRFYAEALGMAVVERDDEQRQVVLRTPDGDDALTLAQARDGEEPHVDHLGFLDARRDLDAAVEKVEAAGGVILRRSSFASGQPTVFFADSDGFVVQL